MNVYDFSTSLLSGGLRQLDLCDKWVGLDGAAELMLFLGRSCSTLTALHLASNNFGAEGATCAAEVVSKLTRLQILDLQKNGFGPEGGKKAATMISGLTPLNFLDLSFNDLDTACATNLGHANSRVT